MSYDLHGGLHDLSDDPHACQDGPSLPTVLTCLRHERHVRAVRRSIAGVAVVAVVAAVVTTVGAAPAPTAVPPAETVGPGPAWTPDPTPVPTPPGPAPAPAPAPAPSQGPSVWESGVGCGASVTSWGLDEDGGFPEYSMLLTDENLLYGPQVTADPTAAFRLTIAIVPNVTNMGVQPVVSARIVDVLAGRGENFSTIEGVPTSAPSKVSRPVAPVEDGFAVAADVRLRSCDGSPLAGETYNIAAVVEVTLADGSVVTLASVLWAYLGHEPDYDMQRYPLPKVSGDQAQVRSTGRLTAAGLPGCGQPYSRGAVPGAGLSVTLTPTYTPAGRYGPGYFLSGEGTLENTGTPIANGIFGDPVVTLTRGGVVVAQTQDMLGDTRALIDWNPGDTVHLFGNLVESACEPIIGYASPGGYEVWAMVPVWTTPHPDGTPRFIYGGPWPLTIPDAPTPTPSPSPTPAPPPTPSPPARQ
jgi:hypothetical protein